MIAPPEGMRLEVNPYCLDAEPRAIVYLAVDWSVPERSSRTVVRAAFAQLTRGQAIAVAAVDENSPSARSWLAAKRGESSPLGAGGILWLECGTVVDYVVNAASLGIGGIVTRTLRHWGQPTKAI